MKLTTDQKKAAENSRASTSIVADAGSGKTRVLTEYYKYLVQNQSIPVSKILTFTFTEKAAFEIEDRISREDLIPKDQRVLFNISTIHSFCLKILKQYGFLINLNPDFSVLSELEEKLQSEEIIFNFLTEQIEKEDKYFLKLLKAWGYQKLSKILNKLLSLSYLLEDHVNQDSFLIEEEELVNITQALNKQWLETKIKNHQLTFLDLEFLTIYLLKNHPSIRSELQKRFQYILVDEFQDTNHLQAQLVNFLFNTNLNKLFIVGDPKQSIYRFRQASLEVFFQTQELIKQKKGLSIQLKETFRMGDEICKFINQVFSPLFLENPQYNYQPMSSLKEEASSYHLYLHPISKINTDQKRRIEAYFIAGKIKELMIDKTPLEEIALLFRSRSQMEIYQEVFNQFEIPTIINKNSSLIQSKEIILIIHLLNYILNPDDPLTQIAVLKSHFINADEAFISDYLTKKKTPDDFSDEIKLKYDDFHQIINQSRSEINQLSSYFVIENLLSRLKLFEEKYQILIKHESIAKREQFLIIIREILKSHPRLSFESMHQKIIKLKNSDQIINSFSQDQQIGVQLLTIHASKGLEFDYVFLPNLYAKTKPDQRDFIFDEEAGIVFKKENLNSKGLKIELDEDEEYQRIKDIVKKHEREESKRLFYVAVTRVKKELFLFLEDKDPKKKIDIRQTSNWNDWVLESCKNNSHPISYLDDEVTEDQSSKDKNNLIKIYPDFTKTNYQNSSKPTLTTSAIETFFRCQKEYELKYLQSIKALSQKKHSNHKKTQLISASQKGNLLHEIFEFLDFKDFSNEETVIDQALINQKIYHHREEVLEEIKSILAQIKNNQELLDLINQEDQSFTELSFLVDLEKFYLKGTIDRIIISKNHATILDFKTEKITNPNSIRERIKIYQTQLLTYALACHQSLEISSLSIALYFSDIDYLFYEKIDLKDLAEFREKLIKNYPNFYDWDGNFEYTTNKNFCNRCEYFERNYCGVRK